MSSCKGGKKPLKQPKQAKEMDEEDKQPLDRILLSLVPDTRTIVGNPSSRAATPEWGLQLPGCSGTGAPPRIGQRCVTLSVLARAVTCFLCCELWKGWWLQETPALERVLRRRLLRDRGGRRCWPLLLASSSLRREVWKNWGFDQANAEKPHKENL
ncbi:hypothetical protein AB1E18_000396 [Capra hircus]